MFRPMKMLLIGFLWTCSLSLAAGKLRMAAFSPGMFSEGDFEVGNGTSLSSINQEKILISWEGLIGEKVSGFWDEETLSIGL